MWIGPGPGQGQPPRICNRLRDNAEARTKQYPSPTYLGGWSPILKVIGERFDPGGKLLDDAGQRDIGIRRQLPTPQVVQLIRQKQGCEQQLPRLIHSADRGAGALRLLIDQPGEVAELLFFAVAA